jgi:uncharacterized protein
MIASVLALLLAASAADALPPPTPGRCVSDPHRILDAASAARLEQACERLDRQGDGQLALAIVLEADLGGMDRDEFANELFRKWGVGHKGRDDGLLIVLKAGSPGHRSLKIETGYGLEGVLPDGKVTALADRLAMPFLRQGRYGEGLVPLVDALGAAMHQEAATGGIERRQQLKKKQDAEARAAFMTGAAFFVALLVWSAALLSLRVAQRPPGRLAGGLGYALLGGGALGALAEGGPFKGPLLIAWAIFAGLGALAFFAVARHRCPRCGHWKTIASEILRQPTYWSDGAALITESCSSCGFVKRYRRAIARRVRTVVITGGGFGGGGFGGGGGGGGGGGDSDSGFGGFGGGSSGGGGGGRDF